MKHEQAPFPGVVMILLGIIAVSIIILDWLFR